MARLDNYTESKRVELLRNLKGEALLDFFYQYTLKMDCGERYDSDTFIAIMDTWGNIRSELLKRLAKGEA